jgi:hypothetical protein
MIEIRVISAAMRLLLMKCRDDDPGYARDSVTLGYGV